MINQKLFIALSILLSVSIFLGAGQAMAASFNLPVTADTLKVGDTFSANIMIDTEGTNINAAQVTLKFPTDILSVSSFDKSDSIFSFWLQDPVFSNQDGTLSFIAGSTSGFSGPSLKILSVKFKALANGVADLQLINGAISASDGSGTNVLNKLNGAKVTVTSSVIAPVITVIPPVVQIKRPIAPASGLPKTPVLTVPLYLDPASWYNLSSVFLVSWDLPADISDVATVINKSPTSNTTSSEGLFNNKTFPALDSGIWYLHVRFKNSIGWGPSANYRIAIDTAPPLSFNINLSDGASSDNPTPIITFSSGDQLSGIKNYYVKVDSDGQIVILGSPYTLLPQKPGKHILTVGVQDNAGNITEDSTPFEILPIQAPTMDVTNRQIYTGEGGLVVSGQSLPNITVVVQIKNQNNEVVYSFDAPSTASGTWIAKFDTPLKNGKYYLEATAKDSRGALSLPVKSDTINVQERPILVIWGFGITYIYLIILLLILSIGGYIIGWYSNKLADQKRQRRIIISQRDVFSSFNSIKKDIETALKSWDDGKVESHELTQVEYVLRQINDNIVKLQKYIASGIKDIEKK